MHQGELFVEFSFPASTFAFCVNSPLSLLISTHVAVLTVFEVSAPRVTDARAIDLPEEKHRVADIADFAAVLEAVQGMDAVVHMAAEPAGGDWESVLRNNIVGAYNVFEA